VRRRQVEQQRESGDGHEVDAQQYTGWPGTPSTYYAQHVVSRPLPFVSRRAPDRTIESVDVDERRLSGRGARANAPSHRRRSFCPAAPWNALSTGARCRHVRFQTGDNFDDFGFNDSPNHVKATQGQGQGRTPRPWVTTWQGQGLGWQGQG